MNPTRRWLIPILVGALCISMLNAGESDSETGRVQLPLDVYKQLLQQASDPTRPPRPAPSGYALGSATVDVQVAAVEPHASAIVRVQLAIDVLDDDWVLVPVLPVGTPVESATVGGRPIQLLSTPQGLAWGTKQSGSHLMSLVYKVDAGRSEAGFTLPLPLPEAAAINLTATLPGTGLDTAVIPSAGTQATTVGPNTRITATIPTTSGVQISWHTPGRRGFTMSRASYAGKLAGDAMVWTGELSVELFAEETATLPLLPCNVTLTGLRVDGKKATILVENGQFATLVRGRGLHEVEIAFQTPILRGDGPPRVDVQIPQIPASRFDLTLPGKKELTVTPASNVETTSAKGATRAIVHVPLTPQVSFAWSEAVPEELRTELRSNAATYHTAHAEEDVLYMRAMVLYEVNRGETNVIELELPAGVQINRISSDSGAIADWRVTRPAKDGPERVSVFLDRQLRGQLLLDVYYDRSLPRGTGEDRPILELPLIRAADAQRQKGMVALLANTELTLNPVEAVNATKVGENQLPAFVRDAVAMTVAHTFKYTDTPPLLTAEATVPERVQGKFDAQVDTLVSLGDVTLTGSASIEVNIKSGSIMELQLELPDNVSLLQLTVPSLRTYTIDEEQRPRIVDIEFTQELEGQFRFDLTYERILADGEQVSVPTLAVRGAEVEQGRIAVEALSAVEVQPAAAEQLSALDVNELPQQLILKTTNPILLAYKYVHADPPHELSLEVTRHAVLSVQEAAIDQADYRTLFTPDGLLVTTAEFTVRNSRKQFLRVRLPAKSEVWSAFVDGRPEKPALADNQPDDGSRDVLIKIINSTRPFHVHLIYATDGSRIGRLGVIEGRLPDPDILVTRSHWDVYLPDELRYDDPTSNMELAQAASRISRGELDAELARLEDATGARQAIEPLRIMVPTAGIHFAFEKLYANQDGQSTWIQVPYAAPSGVLLGHAISFVGIGLVWLGILAYLRRAMARLLALGIATLGAVLLFVSIGVYHLSPMVPLVVSLILGLVLAARLARRSMGPWREVQAADRG